MAEQEVENLSGLSPNPDKDIFVVRENGTTCLMAEFAVKFVIPYDVLALNGIDVSFLTHSLIHSFLTQCDCRVIFSQFNTFI